VPSAAVTVLEPVPPTLQELTSHQIAQDCAQQQQQRQDFDQCRTGQRRLEGGCAGYDVCLECQGTYADLF